MLLKEALSNPHLSATQRSWLEEQDEQLFRLPEEQRWRQFVSSRPSDLSFEAYLACWRALVSATVGSDTSRPIWFPDPNDTKIPLKKWMAERGLTSVSEFHRWSCLMPEAFWAQVIDSLGIRFQSPPERTMEPGESLHSPRWLPGAKLNIIDSCFQAPDHQVAIVAGRDGTVQRRQTYGELRRATFNVAGGLRKLGFLPGQTIGVMMPMNLESISIYLGIIAAGCIVVSLADSFAPPEIKKRLELTETQTVITCGTVERLGKPIDLYRRVVDADASRVIVVPDFSTQDKPQSQLLRDQDVDFAQLLNGDAVSETHPTSPDSAINILFSSGTTGTPKCIPWNQLTPIKCAMDGMLLHGIGQGDVVCWPTNLGWMMGPWLIFATLLRQGTIALHEDAPVGETFGNFIEDAKVNMLGVVPTLVRAWRSSRCMEPFNWDTIRCFSSTGESSQAEDMVYLSFLGNGKPIIEYCGGTEIGGGYISSTCVEANYPAAFNTAAFGLDFKIVDEQQQSADEGELYLVPPSIGLSQTLLKGDHEKVYYVNTPTLPNGMPLRKHGDFFRRLKEGLYAAGGRVDDTMNLGGIKVSSAEIERTINKLDGITESAAVAVAEEQGGVSSLVIFVVLSDAKLADSDSEHAELMQSMNQQIRSKLNPLFKISRVEVVDELPRTSSNKVMRRMLRSDLR